MLPSHDLVTPSTVVVLQLVPAAAGPTSSRAKAAAASSASIGEEAILRRIAWASRAADGWIWVEHTRQADPFQDTNPTITTIRDKRHSCVVPSVPAWWL